MWRFDRRSDVLPPGRKLRLETVSPAVVRWTCNQWDTVYDTRTALDAAGRHTADLATEELPPGTRVQFTFYWPEVKRWEGEDFALTVQAGGAHELRRAAAEH